MSQESGTHPKPRLRGLVLAGGRSRRMGREKGLLCYHGEPEVWRLWRLLQALCGEAYVSLRAEQAASERYSGLPSLVDQPPGAGPATGLLAAWRRAPDSAWLAVAVDLPFLDSATLESLVAARRTDCLGTAFEHPEGTLEPLCTIYEPAARAVLAGRIVAGDASLRALLEAGPARRLQPASADAIVSVNSVEEYRRVAARLGR